MRLDEEGHRRVSEAVLAAEGGTSGEIVTIVADKSDSYHDAALHYAVLLMLLVPVLAAAWPAFPERLAGLVASDWGGTTTRDLLLGIFVGQVVTFLLVRLLLAWMPLRFALVPKATRRRRVRRRALELFRVGAEARTVGRTGILVYLSMGEHMAEIVADEAIHSRVAPEQWGEAMAALVAEVRHGRLAEGMVAAVGHVGTLLAQHLPRQATDQNELPDRLIEL